MSLGPSLIRANLFLLLVLLVGISWASGSDVPDRHSKVDSSQVDSTLDIASDADSLSEADRSSGADTTVHAPLLDSARAAETRGDYLTAIDYYKQSLVAYPSSEKEIRQILSQYFEDLGLTEDFQANKVRLNVLDSLASQNTDSEIADSLLESIEDPHGFYVSGKIGYSQAQNVSVADSLVTKTSTIGIGGGYRFAVGDYENDIGLSIAVNRDKYVSKVFPDSLPSKSGDWAPSPEITYVLSKGDFFGMEDIQRTVTKQANKATADQPGSVVNDTMLTSLTSFSYTTHDGDVWNSSLGADLNYTVNQTLDASVNFSNHISPSTWFSFKLNWTGGYTRDLYKTAQYTIYTRYSLDTLQTHLDTLNKYPLDSSFISWVENTSKIAKLPIKRDSLTYQQAYTSLAFKPRFTWGIVKLELDTKLSYYYELSTERYFVDSLDKYSGDIIQIAAPSPASQRGYYGEDVNANGDSLTYILVKLTAQSHHPAWLNLDLKPTLRVEFTPQLSLNAFYDYNIDLWRDDYVLNPVGSNISNHFNKTFNIELDYSM